MAEDSTVKRYREAKTAYDRASTRREVFKGLLHDATLKRDECWSELLLAADSLSDEGRNQIIEEQFGK